MVRPFSLFSGPWFLYDLRLQEETAKVEEYLLNGYSIVPSFTDTIIRCISLSKANAFENLLEPLQKLLRLSPPIARTLARPDMFSRVGQKLHHSKPAVRVNLLRILSTICNSSEEQGGLLIQYGILDSIRELQSDSRVLVRELATQLIKSSEESSISFSNLNNGKRRTPFRRQSTSANSPNLIPNPSMPSSPQMTRSVASNVILEGRETPRNSNPSLNGSHVMRPGSRDGRSPSLFMTPTNVPASRPRIPRVISHRASQQSMSILSQKEDPRLTSGRPSPSLFPFRRRRQTNSPSDFS